MTTMEGEPMPWRAASSTSLPSVLSTTLSWSVAADWISAAGETQMIAGGDIQMIPKETVDVAGRKVPVEWQIAIPSRSSSIACKPLNPMAWMGTGFSYWEGPISFAGTHDGVGYLELTGY